MQIDESRLHEEVYRWEVVERLIQDHGAELTRYCTTWLGEGLAEEVTQDVFVTAWENLPKYQPVAPLNTWLFGIARKKSQQAFRNRARRREIDRAFMADIRQRVHADAPVSPEHIMRSAAQSSRLHECLTELSENYRMVLILYYWKDVSVADIADVLGKSEPAIRKLLERAKRQLREKMRHEPEA
jgi:RNA polymerase sigma-70 factor (ECF subfamily)